MMTDRTRKMRAGKAILCLMAAFGAVTACTDAGDAPQVLDMDTPTTAIDRDSDPVVAQVDGTLIYQSDVKRAAIAQGLIGPGETLETDSNVFRVTIDELIDQRLLTLDAVAAGVLNSEEAQRRLAMARERILSNYRVEAHLAETVNDETIRDLYEAQNNLTNRGEERRARQIITADEATANEVLDRLADEEDFEVLAAELSIDPATSQSGGELGWLSRDMPDPALRDAVFRAAMGDRIGPLQGEAGWYVLEVLDRRIPNQRSFEDMREDIERFMTFEAVESLMSELREDADIDRLYETDNAADATPEP